jgi:hypothetical protein
VGLDKKLEHTARFVTRLGSLIAPSVVTVGHIAGTAR